jgi:ribonuclease PH
LSDAVSFLLGTGLLKSSPVIDSIAAISVGKVEGEYLLDLAYEEDSKAEVDMNVVMTGAGKLVEVQGTAEGEPFDRSELNILLDLAEAGIKTLMEKQIKVLQSDH